jgi:hypothetical protein
VPIALYIILIVIGIWNLYLTKKLSKLEDLFEGLARVKKGSLTEILTELIKQNTASKREFNELYREIERLDREKTKYVQKMGIVRFHPFGENEYEQSFSLSLLDAVGTGVVITSIHTNARARIYLKNVTRGQSKIELSPEEKNAIQLAIRS